MKATPPPNLALPHESTNPQPPSVPATLADTADPSIGIVVRVGVDLQQDRTYDNYMSSFAINFDRSAAHDPRAIANQILRLRREEGKPLTVMQLVKLVYIADGWSMELLGKPLSKENAQAWKFGPVYPTLYSALKHFGSSSVTDEARSKESGLPYVGNFAEKEIDLIREVVKGYGQLTAWQLSNLTHQPGTPWSDTSERGSYYADIDPKLMAVHFKQLRESRVAQAA